MKPQARILGTPPVTPTREGRGRAGALSGLAVLLVLGWCLYAVTRPDALPIREVRIEGSFRQLSGEDLRRAVAPLVRGGFFTLDVGRVRQGLLAEPWVAAASVRRVWPDGLLVSVEERVAVARWGEDALVTAEGQVFRPRDVESAAPALPRLDGPDGTASIVLAHWARLGALLAPLGRPAVALALTERRSWSFELAGGPAVVVGRSAFDARITRFVERHAALAAAGDPAALEVDLRYSNGFAVRARPPRAEAAQADAGVSAQSGKPGV